LRISPAALGSRSPRPPPRLRPRPPRSSLEVGGRIARPMEVGVGDGGAVGVPLFVPASTLIRWPVRAGPSGVPATRRASGRGPSGVV